MAPFLPNVMLGICTSPFSEVLKVTIADEKAEKDARRDYLYEARKRLYQEYEPLFFQLVGLS